MRIVGEYSLVLITFGDKYQLAPIGETESLFYSHHPVDVSLSQNMRNDREEFNRALAIVRHSIQQGYLTFNITEFLQNPCFQYDPKISTENVLKAFVRENKENSIVLAYRTGSSGSGMSTVKKINDQIRRLKFGVGAARQKYVKGERILFTNYFKKYMCKVSSFPADQRVLEEYLAICEKEEGERVFSKKFYTCEYDTISEIAFGTEEFFGKEFKVYRLYLESLSLFGREGGREWAQNCEYITSLHESQEEAFEHAREKVRAKMKREVNDLQHQCKLECNQVRDVCDAHARKINDTWRDYFRRVARFRPPIDYAYATSIHKSQGSTYARVWVNEGDFRFFSYHSSNVIQYLKSLYVALSRSQSDAVIF
jgi:hypothetical protein